MQLAICLGITGRFQCICVCHMSVCISIHVCICIHCVCDCHGCTYINVYGYVSVCMFVSNVSICICVFVCISLCVCLYVYASVCVYVFTSVSLRVYIPSVCTTICAFTGISQMGQPSRSSFPSHPFPDSERPRTKNVTEVSWIVGMCLSCSHSGQQAQQTLITVLNLKTDDVGEERKRTQSKHWEVQRKESRIHELPAG